MKKCKNCDNQIEDKYSICMDCNSKTKPESSNDLVIILNKLTDTLTKINWNLGAISKKMEEKHGGKHEKM